jgi:hypothetical protein
MSLGRKKSVSGFRDRKLKGHIVIGHSILNGGFNSWAEPRKFWFFASISLNRGFNNWPYNGMDVEEYGAIQRNLGRARSSPYEIRLLFRLRHLQFAFRDCQAPRWWRICRQCCNLSRCITSQSAFRFQCSISVRFQCHFGHFPFLTQNVPNYLGDSGTDLDNSRRIRILGKRESWQI